MSVILSDSVLPARSNQSAARHRALFLLLLLSGYPLGAVALLYSFVCRARLKLGFWPSPYRPDPKDLGFDLHYLGVLAGLLTAPIISLMCVGFIIAARVRWRNFPMWRLLAYAAGCAAWAFCLVKLDPGDFVEWFFD